MDQVAFDAAGRKLGLRSPIKATIAYYSRQPFEGRYVDFRAGVHRIATDGEQSARDASQALWHELGHAVQVERLGGRRAFNEQVGREMEAAGINRQRGVKWWQSRRYRNMPLEREAEAVTRQHAKTHPLCRDRDR